MPRLSNELFLERCHVLRDIWLNQPSQFGVLSVSQQWDLHAYFQPSKDLADRELLDHRLVITKERPTLPNRAGKAFVLIHTAEPKGNFYPASKGHKAQYITIKPVARPEPDLHKLAQAILSLAQDMAKKEREP